MSYVEHETVINVPSEEVFAALLRVEAAPQWMAGLEEVHNVTGAAQGDSFEWTFKMAGRLTFRGKTVFSVVEPGRRLVEEGSGDLTNTWDWRLSPEMAGTHVKVRVDYTVPGGAFLGAIADKLFVEKQNQKDLEQSLADLKRMLEG
jgi:uncharacterized membrane protein